MIYLIGNFAIVSKGTYLYALISGYDPRRVKTDHLFRDCWDDRRYIQSSFSIFDVGWHGREFMYLPAAFREFQRNSGEMLRDGMEIWPCCKISDANEQAVYGSHQKNVYTQPPKPRFPKKLSKRNKGPIFKYGTSVYLIDCKRGCRRKNGKMIQTKIDF